jgi:protein-L-isoaspartate(D-aspartate) O-methyltransferase
MPHLRRADSGERSQTHAFRWFVIIGPGDSHLADSLQNGNNPGESVSADPSEEEFSLERRRMVEDLRRHGFSDEPVLKVMRKVLRHRFVPDFERPRAYDDDPLSIGHGQTISQPYMVAIMTRSLCLSGKEKVLEIGTGSGYQTAVLAELAAEVYTIERVEPLLRQAEKRLTELGYGNIEFRVGDGTLGWPEKAPFDRILVTAGAPGVAEPWKKQLADGGKLAAPIGPRYAQTLTVYTKHGEKLKEEAVCGCVFVPLLGEFGWREG